MKSKLQHIWDMEARNKNRFVHMFYSAEAAVRYGYNTALVPTDSGPRKLVKYTSVGENPDSYQLKDRKLVWEGRYEEMQVVDSVVAASLMNRPRGCIG